MQRRLDDLINTVSTAELQKAAERLSERYRAQTKPYLIDRSDYIAYLAMRFPGTYAAISAVLKRCPDMDILSMMDLGAGPGTGWLAAKRRYKNVMHGTLVEADPQFIDLGQDLVRDAVAWNPNPLPCQLVRHDLVLMSYSLGEMPNPEAIMLLAWQSTLKLLVIIEPGTPAGYQLIMKMRNALIEQGAHIVAPCPSAKPCPMVGSDWCHFPARVERTKLHMHLKSATLGYEDEKYSYLIVSREPLPTPESRIIANPVHHKGHCDLLQCTEGTIKTRTVSKREGDIYRQAKKLKWGDGF